MVRLEGQDTFLEVERPRVRRDLRADDGFPGRQRPSLRQAILEAAVPHDALDDPGEGRRAAATLGYMALVVFHRISVNTPASTRQHLRASGRQPPTSSGLAVATKT